MSKYLKFDLPMYGQDNLIPLTRGDDWLLSGKVILLHGDQQDDYDLTAIQGATAFWPGATGALTGSFAQTDGKSGKFTIGLPASASIGALLSDTGTQPYILLKEAAPGQTTIYPLDQPLKIQDPGFTNL